MTFYVISVTVLLIVYLQNRRGIHTHTYILSVPPDSNTRNQYLKLFRYIMHLCIYHKELYPCFNINIYFKYIVFLHFIVFKSTF